VKNLTGPDASIEISLKEYGIAWEVQDEDTLFYYGIDSNGKEYTRFDYAFVANSIDIQDDYDWVDFAVIADFAGQSLQEWKALPLPYKIHDLVAYYGYENVFGSSYTEGDTYEDLEVNK